MTQPALVVAFSDIHVNSVAGLIPPTVRRDDGSTHRSNKGQRWLWKQYLSLWADVAKRKEELGARCVVVFNGDGPDRNWHSNGYDLIAVSRSDIVRWTVDVLKPARAVADTFVVNRGTPAHEGGTGELSELVAQQLDTLPSPEGSASWWWPVLDINGKVFAFGHRPPHNTRLENTRNNGAKRTAFAKWAAYHRMGDPVPDVLTFSHVHHVEQGEHCGLEVRYTPPWKQGDAYGNSAGFAGVLEPVGAWIYTVRDGEITFKLWERRPPAIKAVRV